MKVGNIGAVPVCEDCRAKKLIGIVTDRDLAVSVVAEARDPNNITVQEIMTREPVACQGGDDLERALETMSLFQVRRVPVVGATGELIGVISQADLAIRTGQPQKTAEVLTHISKPSLMQTL